jgi:rhodanese-related sulfurtransferase
MRSTFLQLISILFLSLVLGALRPHFPKGIAWTGKWPTAATSAEDAYKMMAKPDDPAFASLSDAIDAHDNKTATFIDARSTDEFKAGRIPASRTLPFYEMETYQAAALKDLKLDSPLILYCEGVGCELSFFLGRELQGMGYTNIKIFYGGYPEWQIAGLPIEK